MEGTRKYRFIQIKKGTHTSSFICSSRVLDCYRLCAPPTFSYLEIEHRMLIVSDMNGICHSLALRLVLSAGLKPATLGLESPCSIQLSYESIILISTTRYHPSLITILILILGIIVTIPPAFERLIYITFEMIFDFLNSI